MFRVVAVCHPAFRYVHGNGIQNTAVSILAPVEITVAVVSISPASVKGLCGKGMGLQDSGIEGPGLQPRRSIASGLLEFTGCRALGSVFCAGILPSACPLKNPVFYVLCLFCLTWKDSAA